MGAYAEMESVSGNMTPIKADSRQNSLDVVLDELTRQAMRLDELAAKMENTLTVYLRPDDRPSSSALYPSGVDVPGDASPVAQRVYAQNDNLRMTANLLENILRRIDA
jgi:hypothetical protein